MLVMVFYAIIIFGCGRVRFSKREIKSAEEKYQKTQEKELPAMVTRNGIQLALPITELTVGDKILLAAGDIVPADCFILFCEN